MVIKMSYEKRRSRRIPVDLQLEVSSIFKQDNIKVKELGAKIDVTDVSRTGIGFRSESILPVGFYFNAKLTLGKEDNVLYCVVKIIRSMACNDNRTAYGCEFIGLAPVFSYVFDEFEAQNSN